MDVGLLESGGSSPRRDRKHGVFNRRNDAIAHGSTYQKAAALVDLAEDGIGIPEEIFDLPSFGSSLKSYLTFIQFDILWSLNCFALIVLNFFEKPLWCSKDCGDSEYYFLGQLPYLTSAESLVFEGITLVILSVHTVCPITYEGLSVFWKSHLNKLKVLFLLALIADLIVYIIYLSPTGLSTLPFRIAPYIRVLLFVVNISVQETGSGGEPGTSINTGSIGSTESPYSLKDLNVQHVIPVGVSICMCFILAANSEPNTDIRDSIVILGGMFLTYLNVLALFLLFLLFSSWLAYVIFEDTEQGNLIFTSYGETLYQMFVLFTTSNNPDVWIPGYKQSRWYSLFFVIYVLLGVYFVTSLILAVVYESFKSELVKQVAEKDRTRTRILKRAFSLMDTDNLGYLDKDQCIRLFEELNGYRTLPKISREDFELIFDELDDSHDVKINLDEFADLSNAIGLRFQKEDSESVFERCPRFYHSSASKSLKNFVRGPNFIYAISFILILNFVTVVIETTLDIEDNSGQDTWQTLEFIFGWLYVLEMALKVYSYGFMNYWRDGQNRFDFVITWVIVIGETATFLTPSGMTFLSNGEWIRYLLIARMLRLVRLLMNIKQYRAFVSTFLTLIPSLMPYLGTIFCVMCLYCSLGVQIFGGIVNAGNPKLSGTDLDDSDYLLFNFNDYPNGMVTLFNLLVMNNWQIWMQSYKDLTGTAWTHVYFISFYLITILLLLNLVVAFVLEAFFAEMELESSGVCEETEGDGKVRRRNIGTKSRNQRVEMLLHHMLSAELNKTEHSSSENQ